MRRVMKVREKVQLLPAGRDLLFERPCRVKRFLALAAEEPDWFAEASAEVGRHEETGRRKQEVERRKEVVGRRKQEAGSRKQDGGSRKEEAGVSAPQ